MSNQSEEALEYLRKYLRELANDYESRANSQYMNKDESGYMFCLGKRSAFIDVLYQLDYIQSGWS